MHIFLSGNGGTCKSHLVNVIYKIISKTLLYHCEDPDRPKVNLLEPTAISAVNIGGALIYSGLVIKPGTKLLGLNDKSKTPLRRKLSEVKLLIIEYFSLVSSDLWTDIDLKVGKIFMMVP